VAAFYSPDGQLSVNGASPSLGRKAITQLVQEFMTAFPDLVVLLDDVAPRDNRVVYSWTLIGTNHGPGGTTRPVRISGFELWRIAEDGLIAESQGHFDSVAYQHQLEHGVET
jgi:hypothetical protein